MDNSWLDRAWPRKKNTTAETKREMPEGVWAHCASCGAVLYAEQFAKSLHVCEQCGHHHRIDALTRLKQLNGGGEYTLLGEEIEPKDFTGFVDSKPYTQRLAEAKKKSACSESMIAAVTKIDGVKVGVAIFSFDFIGGSMGHVLGQRFVQAVNYCAEHNMPFVCVTASGGARMQEGIVALFQMAKTSMAISRFKQTGNPYITVLTDPTSGGVSASMAMQADIILAEKGALIGFTGPRVIEQTLRESLPEGFQRAEFLLKHGAVDAVVARKDLPKKLARLLRKLLCYKNVNNKGKESHVCSAE